MALSEITLPTETISVGKASFSVRGLSFDDMSALIGRHQGVIESLLGRYDSKTPGVEAELIQVLVRESPTLAAQAIALASDEPEQEAKVRRLPMPVQIDALTVIAKLTFEETGGVKKFAEQLAGLFGGLRNVVTTPTP